MGYSWARLDQRRVYELCPAGQAPQAITSASDISLIGRVGSPDMTATLCG